jgi:hypothetical protein
MDWFNTSEPFWAFFVSPVGVVLAVRRFWRREPAAGFGLLVCAALGVAFGYVLIHWNGTVG